MLLLLGIFVIITRTTCANFEFANFASPVDLEDIGRHAKIANTDNPPLLSNGNNEDDADEEENSIVNKDDESNVNMKLDDCNLASLKNDALYLSEEMKEMIIKCMIPDETNFKDTSNENVNKRRKRSREYSENENKISNKNKRSNSAMSTRFHFPIQDKTISIQEGQEPSQEKKSPSFNPWGGKRMMILRVQFNNQRPIRTPFNSWGGKRRDERFEKFDEEKRGKFFNWGGKRVPFNSWGGKRAMAIMKQKVPFSSWGGKRTPFHSWGGKRGWKLEEEREEIEKRSKSDSSDDLDVKRTKFNAWGGKRSDPFYSWLYKRIPEEVMDKRSPFYSWSEKRDTIESHDDMETKRVPQRNDPGRRVRFNSWGGKRYNDNSVVETPESTRSHWKSFLRSLEDKRSKGIISITNSDGSLIPEPFAVRKIFFPWGG